MLYLLTFLVSFLMTLLIIPFFKSLAYATNFLDYPTNALKKQKKPVPYLGGIALFVGLLPALCLNFSLFISFRFFFVALILLLVIGLVDDGCSLLPWQKFLGQVCAVLIFMTTVLSFTFVYPLFIFPICMLWLLTIINSWNLVDIMDGQATLLALGASEGLFIWSLLQGSLFTPIVSAFVGTLLAFLIYNAPPASIYLGDAGSLYIGGFIAMAPFCLFQTYQYDHTLLIPLIVCAIPLLECFSLIMIRFILGIPPYQGSPHHFMHYLKRQGWSVNQILYYLFTLSQALVFISLGISSGYLSLPSIFILCLIFVAVWFFVLGLKNIKNTSF